MVFCESIVAFDAAINNETDALEILPGSAPLTTRTGRGKPKITHAMYFASTDDITRVIIQPQNANDINGIPIEYGTIYGAATEFDLAKSRLEVPIEVPENCLLTISATSETAANTVVFAWLMLEYPSTGKFESVQAGVKVRRSWEHGAALVSNTEAPSTDITTMLPGKLYQLCGISGVGVNGATAGCVGPVFHRIRNVEYEGAICWIPMCNGAGYIVGGARAGFVDFAKAGIKAPKFKGGTPLLTSCIGYTAEQPQAELAFRTDSLFR